MTDIATIATPIITAIESPTLNPYDDVENWLRGDFQQSPWTPSQTAEYQKQLDSAFGAQNAFVLVWSGDRSYGDKFFTDWDIHGNPKGNLEPKPLLLFKEIRINQHDYVYVSAPRFLIMQVEHGSQLEASWESSSWVADPDTTTGRKRIRDYRPPEFFYSYFRTVAQHESPTARGNPPACCERKWRHSKSICYGRYREPDERDIAAVRQIRESQDAAGVVQRNDEARCAKILSDANANTIHFVKASQRQKMTSVKEMMLEHSEKFFGDIIEKGGITMSPREIEAIVREGLESEEDEEFNRLEKLI